MKKTKDTRIVFIYIIVIIMLLIGFTYAINEKTLSLTINTAQIEIDESAYGETTFNTDNLDFRPILDTDVETSTNNVIKIDFMVGGASTNNTNNIIYDIALNDLSVNCELLSPYIKWKLIKNGTELSSGSLDYKFDTIVDGRMVLTPTQQDLASYSASKTGYDSYTFYMWFSDSCQDANISNCIGKYDQSALLGKQLNGKIEVELYTNSKTTLVRNPSDTLNQSTCTSPNSYTIAYNLNGGRSGANAPTSGNQDAIITIDTPMKTITATGDENGTGATVGGNTSKSQTFAGWTASNIDTTTAYYGTSSSTVTTLWSNGSTKVNAKYFKNLASTTGTIVTLTANWTPTAFNLPTVTKDGYTCGWNTASNGSGTSYDSGASYTPSENSSTSVTMYATCSVGSYYFDLNWDLDGSNYQADSQIKAGLKVDGVDKGYVSDYYAQHPYGTSWEIYGIQINGTNISYSASGTVGSSNTSHSIPINTLTIMPNNSTFGSVSTSTLYVLRNTTYSTSSNVLTLSDGRTVTATANNATGYTTSFSNWSSTSGTISDATTITANFNGEGKSYTVTYNSNNVFYTLHDVTSPITSNRMTYTISGDTITVTANTDDGYGYVDARVYLEANQTYNFSCSTSGTWGANGSDTVEAYLMLNGETNTYYRMESTNYSFTPTTSGVYFLRLDVNLSGKSYTFSNIKITTVVATQTLTYGDTLGTLPTISYPGYRLNGWYTAESGGTKISSSTAVPAANTTYYAQYDGVNKVIIKINVNGGSKGTSSLSGYTVDSDGYVNVDGSPNIHIIPYTSLLGADGLVNPDNASWVNITKSGYVAKSGAEYICASGCTTANKTFNKTSVYNASDFCDASSGDCTVVLNVNWVAASVSISSSKTTGGTTPCGGNQGYKYNFSISIQGGSLSSGKLCFASDSSTVSSYCASTTGSYPYASSTSYGCAYFETTTTWSFWRSNYCAYAYAVSTYGKSAEKYQC